MGKYACEARDARSVDACSMCVSLARMLRAFSANRPLDDTAQDQAASTKRHIIIILCHACIGITQGAYFFLALWCDFCLSRASVVSVSIEGMQRDITSLDQCLPWAIPAREAGGADALAVF